MARVSGTRALTPAVAILNSARNEQTQRISDARSKLFGVDSVVALSDFERYAKDLLPMEAWAYYSTGADTEEGREAYAVANPSVP